MKTCTTCKYEKPISEFHVSRGKPLAVCPHQRSEGSTTIAQASTHQAVRKCGAPSQEG